MRKIVVIVGGGVAGMSAAHELLARSGQGLDYSVRVIERGLVPGGKARSIPVPNTPPSRADRAYSLPVPRSRPQLPGEHGFRFFPGFYRHLPATLETIPAEQTIPVDPRSSGARARTVRDRLVEVPRVELARTGQPRIDFGTRIPRNVQDWLLLIQDAFADLGVSRTDVAFFAARLWQIMTSCDARILKEYEPVTWWNYVDAEGRSAAYRDLLAEGLSRSLLANDPRIASARTVGTTNTRLLESFFDSVGADRVLDGPTSEVWLDPWLRYLKTKPDFEYHVGWRATRVLAKGGMIRGIDVVGEGGERQVVTGDYYIFSVPVERMAELIATSAREGTADLVKIDPGLGGIPQLSRSVAWMNGIQFFLYQPARIVAGHCLFVDSPWSLTAVTEGQFWKEVDLPARGDGTVRDILSVCISNWNAPGSLYGKPARDLSHEQIAAEVWHQLKASLNVGGSVVLRDEDLHSWFLDPDIVAPSPALRKHPERYNDMEPLFINSTNTWSLRPEAKTKIPNMFLAADYVRTNTDVACMEAANEAARRAVNALLDASESTAERCRLWELEGPAILEPLRWLDAINFAAGLPWSFPLPIAFKPGMERGLGPEIADPRRPGSDDGRLPEYIERSGEQTTAAPYASNGTRLYGYVLQGDARAMQKNIVDPCLNRATHGKFDFRVLSNKVLVTFSSAKELRSLAAFDGKKGFTQEKACVVWTPVISTKGSPKLYMFVDSILVDSGWSMATGREVHGFPKQLGQVRVPDEGQPPETLAVSTLVLPEFSPGESTRERTILEVRRTIDGARGETWRDVPETLERVLSHLVHESSLGAGVPPWDVVRGLVEAVRVGGVPILFFKQFRDASDGTRACYQSLVEASSHVTSLREAGVQGGRFDAEVATFASHPLGRDLGVGGGPVPVELAFFVDFDFELTAGVEIWRA